ncbi:small subunit processome component 20 homolog [Ischnura elegans]|uniref:small subunit processome component 20 homolog n=1 Tax=Ischnura elegans TaxID=197161 RepID=UPI001ED879F5|nr:small subunit processome component 20 homolog [Ischnura elegans]
MKNKPIRHKESNTFRFLPFAERIAAIDVDVFHHVDRRRGVEDEGENQTFLYLALEKWNVLNCTDSYSEFRRNFISIEDVETLPQLVLNSRVAAVTLLKSLRNSNYLSLQPVLECVVALAKDLRHDFYQYFPAFMIRIINILTAPIPPEGRGQKEAEIAEWCLSCLAHLCKHLWRSLLKDWEYVYGSLLLPLILVDKLNKTKGKSITVKDGGTPSASCENLDSSSTDAGFCVTNEKSDYSEITEEITSDTRLKDQNGKDEADNHQENVSEFYLREKLLLRNPPEYVRDFIVQSFAFVARKAKDKSVFLQSVYTALRCNTSGIPRTGQLLAEVMRGVQGHFHSCAESMLPLLLQFSCKASCDPSDSPAELGDEVSEDEKSISFQLVKHTLINLLSIIKPEKEAYLLWKVLIDVVNKCAAEYKVKKNLKQVINLKHSIAFLHSVIDFNRGQWLLSDIKQGIFASKQPSISLSNQLANLLTGILRIPSLNESIAVYVSEVVGSVLSSPAVAQGKFRLEQDVAAKLSNQVLMYRHADVVMMFVRRTVDFSGFETLILPHLMSHCCNYRPKSLESSDVDQGKDVLDLLACLILEKAPPCKGGGKDLKDWHQYSLDFKMCGPGGQKDLSYFSELLERTLSQPAQKNPSFDTYVSLLIILPHLKGIRDMSGALIESVNSLFELMDGFAESESLKQENILFLISEAVVALALMKDDGGRLSRKVPCDKVLSTLLPHASSAKGVPALRAIDVYLSSLLEGECENDSLVEGRPVELISNLYAALSHNLSSPYREVCRLTLNIFKSATLIEAGDRSDTGIFSVCLAAEEVPLTIHDFRQKIGLLEGLKSVPDDAFPSFSAYQAKLRYLLGIFFANFKLLWEPTSKLIATIAQDSPKSFWEVFAPQLRLSMAYARLESGSKATSSEMLSAMPMAKKWEPHAKRSFLVNCDYLSAWYCQRFALSDSPDFVNYRAQLLNTMCEMVDICEARNRDVSEIFLSFYKDEFLKSDSKVSPTWDIRKAESDVEMNDVDDDLEESKVDDVEEENFHLSNRISTKAMISFLKLLSKMKNPRAMYKEPELARVYEELISHRNAEIQEHSLDCLLSYRCKILLPYRENLLGLIDEKKLKYEINLFRIDKESELVKEQHRSLLMPLVMQILYSKIQSGNKRTGHQRRSLILRFIAGCHDNEVAMFLKMAFSLLVPYIGDLHQDTADMVRHLKSSIVLEKAVHPKRLLSSSNLLVVVVERLGSLLLSMTPASDNSSVKSEALEFLLRCLLSTNALIAGEYAKKDLIHPCHYSCLRSARAAALGALATFFRRLDYYPWSVTSVDGSQCMGDLEAVFETTVWPWLDNLPVEGIHSPTALLKLIIVWSENPRYYPLLAKQRLQPEGKYKSVMPAVMSLLSGKHTKPPVVNAILDIVERLMTYACQKESDVPMEIPEEKDFTLELPPLDVGPMIDLPEESTSKLHVSHKLNFGSKLILPHVPCILQVLTQRFRALKKGGSPSPRDLRVLSLLSELVWEPEDSDALVTLILPVAARKASLGTTGVEMCQLLTTANNLLRNVPNPRKFIRAIATLFSTVDGRSSRTILCEMLDTVASREEPFAYSLDNGESNDLLEMEKLFAEEDLKNASRILKSLNSWDPARLEEPDYARRLDSYKEIKTMREDQIERGTKFPIILGILIVHNSFYAIRNDKDLSLKESAGHCLQTLAPLLAISSSSNAACKNLVIGETILALITKALKDRKAPDSLHHDTISTLGAMVHQCSTLHPLLQDLSCLASQDPEVDFFENIRHLQLHRRGRALMRFVQDAKEKQKPMGAKTLTNIILPLSFHYLFNARYAKNNSLVDSAIEAVGAACHCLPWHHYQAILKHRLGRLPKETIEFGRQPIRLIVAILNNFHFNLSQADKEDVEPMDTDAKTSTDNSPPPKNEGSDAEPEEGIADIERESITADNTEAEVEESEEIIGTEGVEDDNMSSADKNDADDIEVPAWSQELLLSPSVARKARKALATVLLPRLHSSLVAPTERDSSHKLNRRAGGAVGADVSGKEAKNSNGPKDEEETLVMRVPIALAAIKMLQRLPSDFMDQNLSGVLLKVLAFLKCRLESVRRVARDTLVDIGVSLGPSYLPTIIREMSSLPSRGYAFHVLAFTAHALLVSMVQLMALGDMDKCLHEFVEICKADLFGVTSEEKEVTKITAKVYEARSHKSYDTFYLMSKVISEPCLIDLIQPLKEVLDQTHSFKFVKITKECLSRIVKGFVENKFLSPPSLLAFSYGLLSKSITALWPSSPKKQEKQVARRTAGAYAGANGKASMPLEVPPDPFLIPKEPRKVRSKVSGVVDRVGAQANAHALLEFGLQLLNLLLKKEEIRWRKGVGVGAFVNVSDDSKAMEVVANDGKEKCVVDTAMLDPLVPIVCECLESKYAKLTTLALNCFRMMVRMDLPSMDDHIVKAASSVYSILHKYAGASSGDNYNLAVSAFKTVAVLVRNIRTLPVEEDHLSALLTYVSRDLDLGGEVGTRPGGYGPARTATAFGVLRSIIARRLRSPIIPSLMKRVAKLSISAQASHVQAQSRQVFLQFLMDYPMHKKKLEQHIVFFLGQLNYELLSGRESALEFLYSVISQFPEEEMKNHSGLLFVSLGARLMEEEVPNCKRRIAAVIKALLMRLPNQSRDQLFDIIVIWMKDKEVTHQQVAAQLCGIFVLAEGDAFSARLSVLMPLVLDQLQIYKPKANEESSNNTLKSAGRVHVNGDPGKYVRMPTHVIPENSDLFDGENTDAAGSEPGRFVKVSHAEELNENDEELAADPESSVSEAENDFEDSKIVVDESQESGGQDMSLQHLEDMDEKRDPHIFHILQLILKVFMTCPETVSKTQWRDHTNRIAVLAQSLLAHPHEWIRLASCQVIGVVFGAADAAEVASAALRERKEKKSSAKVENIKGLPFLMVEVNARLKSLILDLSAQLSSTGVVLQLAEQVVKNLVFLARVLKEMDKEDIEDSDLCINGEGKKNDISLPWMIRKMRNIVNFEVAQNPNQATVRSAVFKLLAAVALDLSSDPEHLQRHLPLILGPVVREMENKPQQGDEPRSKEMKELRRLAHEVSELIKEKVGLEAYATVVNSIQRKLTSRRTERKRMRAQEAVSMPEKAAKRKIRKQQVKKQLKKRKFSIMKGRKLK